MSFVAVCDRRGVIEIVEGRTPKGLLPILRCRTQSAVLRRIEAKARHGRHMYNGPTLLVPGVPEAETDDDALDAVIAFTNWVRESAPRARGQ